MENHKKINVGDLLDSLEIKNIFGREPRQEGINFCKTTKEMYLITKICLDNPSLYIAEYNDYWKQGEIYYEGKGQDSQEIKGSNLHL